jgi:molecular chaperone DnaK
MTQQEFKNTFSVSERKVNVTRLKEQYASLEKEIRKTLKQFVADDNDVWAIQTENMLKELENHGKSLSKLNENDATDKRYVIDEAVRRISQEFDKIGGNERVEELRNDYFRLKEWFEQSLPSVDVNKEVLSARYRKILETENMVLQSRSPAILKRSIDRLDDLCYDVLWNNNSYIASRFYEIKSLPEEQFKNYRAAQQTFAKAEKAIDDNRYIDLRRMINDLFGMLRKQGRATTYKSLQDFKGTGIR